MEVSMKKVWFSIALLILSNSAMAVMSEDVSNVLVASAQYSIQAEPDIAFITVGMTLSAESIDIAQAEINRAMLRFKQSISDLVETKNIQTTDFSVREKYIWDKNSQQQKMIGYELSHTLRIKVTALLQTGKVIDNAVKSGLNHFQGLIFDTSKRDELQQLALQKAIEKAVKKAKLMAKSAAVTLGPVYQLAEQSNSIPVRNNSGMLRTMAANADQAAPTEIEAGQLAINASVVIHYRLR